MVRATRCACGGIHGVSFYGMQLHYQSPGHVEWAMNNGSHARRIGRPKRPPRTPRKPWWHFW